MGQSLHQESRKRTHKKVAEGGGGVRSTAHPATDHIVALGDEIPPRPQNSGRGTPRGTRS